MSSKDDPFSSGEKTAITPRKRAASDRPDTERRRSTAPQSGATVIDTAFGSATARVTKRPSKVSTRSDQRDIPSQARLVEAARKIPQTGPNTLLAAATPVLLLLTNLRSSAIDVDAASLSADLIAMVEDFDRAVATAGIDEATARIARYCLCETIDDLVSDLPGFSRDFWMPQGMLAKLFDTRRAGSGFFAALNQVLADPTDRSDLLAMVHACLALGFKGQYRNREGDDLERIRKDVLDTLRDARGENPQGMSVRWQGTSVKARGASKRVPLWTVAAAAVAIVAGIYFQLRSVVTSDAEALAAALLALDPNEPVRIEHALVAAPVAVVEQPPAVEAAPPEPTVDAQLERVKSALKEPMDAGVLSVNTKGEFIVVEIGNAQLFSPGRARIKPEFAALSTPIAAALGAERGTIRIVGHTDSEKPGRGSAFKSNFDLSVARAQAVKDALATLLPESNRLSVEGKGEDEPIADNATPEGRARNRRVDLMIPREAGT